MKQWFEMKEQGAGTWRLTVLLFLYRIFGKGFVRFVVRGVVGVIWCRATTIRQASRLYLNRLNRYQEQQALPLSRFSSYHHMLMYAFSLLDKLDAFMGRTIPIVWDESDDMNCFMRQLRQGQGLFLICSHLGNIEVLPAVFQMYPDLPHRKMHAFMQIQQNAIFHQFLTKHTSVRDVYIHSLHGIHVGTGAFLMDCVAQGDIVMMAGDRVSAQQKGAEKKMPVQLLGQPCFVPKGVFRIARALSVPVYAITCLFQNKKYHVSVRQLNGQQGQQQMVSDYLSFLEEQLLTSPESWFNFYDYWNDEVSTDSRSVG